MLPLLLVGGLLYLGVRSVRRHAASLGSPGGMASLAKAQARVIDAERRAARFTDVAGYPEVKTEISEVVIYLRDPGRYHRAGARGPRGVLMASPPGTGKTLLARAVAGEAQVPFLSVAGSSFVEMFVGVGAARVRDLFQQARTLGQADMTITRPRPRVPVQAGWLPRPASPARPGSRPPAGAPASGHDPRGPHRGRRLGAGRAGRAGGGGRDRTGRAHRVPGPAGSPAVDLDPGPDRGRSGVHGRVRVMFRRLLAAGGTRVGIRPMLATTYAANALSVSVPLAGPGLATAFTFRRFTRQGADTPLAGWSLLAGGVASSAAAAVIVIGGGLSSGSGLVMQPPCPAGCSPWRPSPCWACLPTAHGCTGASNAPRRGCSTRIAALPAAR